jgi:hypothetical protein
VIRRMMQWHQQLEDIDKKVEATVVRQHESMLERLAGEEKEAGATAGLASLMVYD